MHTHFQYDQNKTTTNQSSLIQKWKKKQKSNNKHGERATEVFFYYYFNKVKALAVIELHRLMHIFSNIWIFHEHMDGKTSPKMWHLTDLCTIYCLWSLCSYCYGTARVCMRLCLYMHNCIHFPYSRLCARPILFF